MLIDSAIPRSMGETYVGYYEISLYTNSIYILHSVRYCGMNQNYLWSLENLRID